MSNIDDLLKDAEEIKAIHSNFNQQLKACQTAETSKETVDTLVDDYLNNYNSEELPESLNKVLYIGEREFSIPAKDQLDEEIVKESDKLLRIELASLAQDAEAFKILEGSDKFDENAFTDEEWKRVQYIQEEINFSLRAEAAKKDPSILTNEEAAAKLVEPKNEEVIAKNTAIVGSFLQEVQKLQATGEPVGLLDLSDTYVPPYKPEIDPASFLPQMVAQNVFTINKRPMVNDKAEFVNMQEYWGRPVDAKALSNSMKHSAPDTSVAHQLKGNGLEVPLEIAQGLNAESVAPTQDDLDEVKYAELQVILEFDPERKGRWPQIVENLPVEEVIEEPPPALAPVHHADVFEMMDFLTGVSNPVKPQIDTSEGFDVTAFAKKKKKNRKVPVSEEFIEAFEKTKVFENEEEGKKATKLKKIGGYDYAEILDVTSNVPEYVKMKHNLARTYPFELDPFQQQAIVAMENGNSVFVAAHTSAGKTVVAEYAIALSRKHRSRVVYTSPIKALSNQKFRDFKNEFEDVGLVTGDIQLNTEASCLVMTTEILKSMLYNGRVSPDELEWVIFDEVHYINDAERGHVWEEVLIMLPIQVNIVMLSATVPNCLEFADWVGRIKNRKIYVVQTLYRPVPLAHHLYSGKDKKSQNHFFEIMGRNGEFSQVNYRKAQEAQRSQWSKKNANTNNTNRTYFNKAVDRCHYQTLINFLRDKNLLPGVVFIFSRNRCNQYAEMLYSLDLTTSDEKAAVRRLFTKYLDSFKGSDRNLPQVLQMQQLCYRGFAIHHSGILPILKELVEILFQRGYVKFLFATETFAMGVNMPARTVIFDAIEKFDGNSRRMLNCTEYIQMAGRAGRRGIDDTGVVIILSKGSEPYDYSTLLPVLKGNPVSLESKFRITYNMLLNIIRAEQLNIEDMLQRSYVERVSLRALESRKEKITETKTKLDNLPQLSCRDCLTEDYSQSISHYHDSLIEYIRLRSIYLSELIQNYGAANHLQAGRYLLVCYPKKNIACMLVCVHSFYIANDKIELNVVALKTESTSSFEDAEYDDLSDIAKALKKTNLLFDHAVKHGLETLVDNRQNSSEIEMLKNFPLENVLAIVKRKTKYMNEKEIDDYLQQQMITSKRRNSPSRIMSNLMTEMESTARLAIQKPDEFQVYKIGDDLSSKDVQIHDALVQFSHLRNRLADENFFLCRLCIDFEDHIKLVRERKLLEDEYENLKYQTSANALLLSDDHSNCLKVLRELNFIDKDDIITIKGRVAAQINEDTLLLTELIFENKLQQRGCSEIAAMLCPLTAQHYAAKDKTNERDCRIITKEANQDVINSLKKEIASMANKIDAIEAKYKVVDARRGQEPTFGLMEAVYQWAEGMSFEQITHLTDAHEGIIVRCIQRLDEILKDIRNAGRIIGDNTLVQKMVDTSQAIRRDIVFAASLYTAQDD